MTRRGFYVLLASILIVCVLCPYVEVALNWNQSIFDTGYDTESTVAVIALLLILAFGIGGLLAHLVSDSARERPSIDSHVALRPRFNFISTIPEVFPPPPLRI